jgi:hypothetical protein
VLDGESLNWMREEEGFYEDSESREIRCALFGVSSAERIEYFLQALRSQERCGSLVCLGVAFLHRLTQPALEARTELTLRHRMIEHGFTNYLVR